MKKHSAAWHELVETRDISALDTLLTDEVVFHSPVVHTPIAGKAMTKLYLTAAFNALFNDSFEYVREISDEHNTMLEFTVTINETYVNGVDIIRWNEQGEIVDFKVMLRPAKALDAVKQVMQAQLAELSKA